MTPLLIIGGTMIVLSFTAYYAWDHLHWFHSDSETIFFARLQMIVGAVWEAFVQTNAFPGLLNIYDVQYPWLASDAPALLIAWGVITESARRCRATDLK